MTNTATLPADVEAAILRKVAGSAHPLLELPNIAHRHSLTIDELKKVLAGHGDTAQQWLTAAKKLEEQAAWEAQPDTVADDTDAGHATGLQKVRTYLLLNDPDNVRENLGDVADLADSILAVGLLQPIVARRHGGRLIVVAGHRRLAAVRRLNWTTVDCIIREDMRPDHVLAAMLIENGQRRDLDPIEEARGLRRLKAQLDCTDLELGRRVGRNQVYVSNRIALLSLSTEEQEQVRNGIMRLGEATDRGRTNSGKKRPGASGKHSGYHLSHTHDLAQLAKNRCLQMGHKRGRTIGGTACGECWESVIRADERDHMHEVAGKTGNCPCCGSAVEPAAVPA